MKFGTETYRAGALERIGDAQILFERRRFSAAVYVAGLAVEGMLRSLIWLQSKEFDERHDLKDMATRISDLGLLRTGDRDLDFVSTVQAVTKRWSNSVRFAGDKQLQHSWSLKNTDRKGNPMHQTCEQHVELCLRIVRRCEALLDRIRE